MPFRAGEVSPNARFFALHQHLVPNESGQENYWCVHLEVFIRLSFSYIIISTLSQLRPRFSLLLSA